MREITADKSLVAFCGLYCGACGSYLREQCPGCAGNNKATWCAIRTCCKGKAILSCAECTEFDNAMDCRKFNNLMSKLFGLVFRSDRGACLRQIKGAGLEGHAKKMAAIKAQTIRR
ncbi:MAG TPA: DUF3795 domain-containing protein [Chitinivibrionales bacterium]|jgi:hypothetical protein|nr:DUF3795 domain-containing protein [Chitinivibrionales bacterium]